jgi:hypothetical protein
MKDRVNLNDFASMAGAANLVYSCCTFAFVTCVALDTGERKWILTGALPPTIWAAWELVTGAYRFTNARLDHHTSRRTVRGRIMGKLTFTSILWL